MNKIRIVDLEVRAQHGVLEHEQKNAQMFKICAELTLASVPAQDELGCTINYAAICKEVTDFMTGNTFQLIETLADKICRQLLARYTLLTRVEVEVKKPEAPIGLPIGYVSAVASRKRHTAYIGLGSNLGDREQNLRAALKSMDTHDGCGVIKASAFYNTKAYGKTDQPDFLNAVCMLSTVLEPSELLEALWELELAAGRVRTEKWGARTLDLDILFYDDRILSEPSLTVPHPDLHNRRFVLEPMCEIAPDHRHPVCKKTIRELLNNCEEN